MPAKISEKESPYFANLVSLVTMTVGAKVTTTINVACVFKDANNQAIAEKFGFKWYLSSDAAGLVIAAAPSSGIAIGTNGLLIEEVADVAGLGITTATGLLDVTLNDSGSHNFYFNVVLPSGKVVTSGIIAL